MAHPSESVPEELKPKVRWLIVLRPLLIWLVISLFIIGYDYDRVHAPRTHFAPFVTIDDVPKLPGQYTVEIDGAKVSTSGAVKIGTRRIRIWGPDTTTFETNLFVWYGTNRLDSAPLKRLRGDVELTLTPPPTQLSMVGPYDEVTVSNVTTLKTNIPVGEYTVTLTYGDIVRTDTIHVETNRPVNRLLRPKIGIAVVNSIPLDAEYRLSSTNSYFRRKQGTLPIVLPLETGQYTLEAWRGNYRKDVRFVVESGKTNNITIPFEYGRLDLSTAPDGVQVNINRRSFGLAPTNLVLQPGTYQLRLSKSGFHPLDIPLSIQSNETITLHTDLVSIGFSQALSNSKRYALNKDFERAVESIDSALSIDPKHTEAQQLRSTYQRALSEKRTREAATALRQQHISTFDDLTRSTKDSSLFDTHTWTFGQGLEKTRIAVRSAITKTSAHYSLESEQNRDDGSVLFKGKVKGLTAYGRHCAVLVASSHANETQVVAKFWDYIPASGSGISIASLLKIEENIPVHPDRFQQNQRQAVIARRKAIADEFKGLIDEELQHIK